VASVTGQEAKPKEPLSRRCHSTPAKESWLGREQTLILNHPHQNPNTAAAAESADKMPPRAELEVEEQGPATAKVTVSQRSKYARPRARVQFRNTHGFVGLSAGALVLAAIGATYWCATQRTSRLRDALCMMGCVASLVTTYTGIKIIDQAPRQTVVLSRPFAVIPPHRDAFHRTSYSIFYLCMRIAWNITSSYSLHGKQSWIWGSVLLRYAWSKFIPSKTVDWTNGNTWIFIVPMALGLSVDALMQLPGIQCTSTEFGTACWNDDIVTQLDLLWILLSGLVIAFVFTVAFRGVMSVKHCYWGAALVVWLIVGHLASKCLLFLRSTIENIMSIVQFSGPVQIG